VAMRIKNKIIIIQKLYAKICHKYARVQRGTDNDTEDSTWKLGLPKIVR
jgi:hypothetical protein